MNTLRRAMIRLFGIIIIFALVFNAPAQASNVSASTAAAGASDSSIMFVENEGQFADVVRYQVLGGSSVISLAQDALWVTLMEETSPNNTVQPGLPLEKELPAEQTQGVMIKLSFAGSNPSPVMEPFDPIETSVNFFHGSDPANWKSNVPVWGGVRYINLYPGIDLEVSSENGQVVQRLVAGAGADLDAVKLNVEGADSIAIEGDHLLLTSAAGNFPCPCCRSAV